jgi:hypothetical protein
MTKRPNILETTQQIKRAKDLIKAQGARNQYRIIASDLVKNNSKIHVVNNHNNEFLLGTPTGCLTLEMGLWFQVISFE